MNILLFLIPMSLGLLLLAIWAFRWAVRKGQFENLDAAAIDILRDDRADQPPDQHAVARAQAADSDGANAPGSGSGAPHVPRGPVDPGPDHAD